MLRTAYHTPDTPTQIIEIRHILAGRFDLYAGERRLASAYESAADAPLAYWVEPMQRSFPTLEAVQVAVERALEREQEVAA